MAANIKCPQCGKMVKSSLRYCDQCGSDLSTLTGTGSNDTPQEKRHFGSLHVVLGVVITLLIIAIVFIVLMFTGVLQTSSKSSSLDKASQTTQPSEMQDTPLLTQTSALVSAEISEKTPVSDPLDRSAEYYNSGFAAGIEQAKATYEPQLNEKYLEGYGAGKTEGFSEANISNNETQTAAYQSGFDAGINQAKATYEPQLAEYMSQLAVYETQIEELSKPKSTPSTPPSPTPTQASKSKTNDKDGASYSGKTVILHSNDVHGAVEGYAYMAYARDMFKKMGAEVILVDAGDFSQGTTYVSSSKGATAVELMNAVGYDVVTLGNHEFDFGYAQLMDNLSRAEFTTICANVYNVETNENVFPATTVIEKGGVKIGFFGMETPETATKVNPSLIKGIDFRTFGDLYKSAQEAIDSLNECDVVIGLTHLGVDAESAANGYRSIDLWNNITGADFLIDGHSHTVMTAGENGEPIQSTGTKFEYIGVIVIDNKTKKIVENRLVETGWMANMALPEDVKNLAASIKADVDAEYAKVFATSDTLLNGNRAPGNRTEETNLGDLITDAMVWSVVREGGIENAEPNAIVGITNGGGIRATVQAGDITKNDIVTVLPFGNTVAVIYVTGEELLEALEASTYATPDAIGGFPQTSGILWSIDTSKEYAQGNLYMVGGKETTYYAPTRINRVTIESINGERFDPAKIYAVVTNSFCASGGDTYAAFERAYNEGSGFDTGIPMDEALMEYITTVLNGRITKDAYGAPQGRLTIIPY